MTFVNTVGLKNETNKIIRRVVATREPAIVTQHGRPAVAIVPLDDSDLVIRNQKAFVRAVNQGLKDIEAGRIVSLKTLVQRNPR